MKSKAEILGRLGSSQLPSAPRASPRVRHRLYRGPASPTLGVQHRPPWLRPRL